ncbi:peptidoglycan-binding domain-containing protein [Actinacidiphila glaucinigra]|uniref:Putative peptidoglycan binding domain-containing protein n=1 Tax=Actinacidiphila glaucinigra TaxID=235986 RepID=A0A239NR12_9ACTN|nr:peptidoglycan-binding domain-containing protein [Actinacidiphila glaucinigra]SNT57361.1 Putative peptidoglycan binding domain-containing protein [Actinacidiphila glaucinigra]
MSRGLARGPKGRGKQVGTIVGVVALVGAGGWFAGTQMQSPADAAASRRPPEVRPVTVAVEHRKLTATVIAQGGVEFGAPQGVSLSGSVGSAGGSGEAEATQRVTKLPQAGATLREGSVLMQVNGRPVFVLRGSVPMYRSLGPSSSGDDVRQLQSALRRLGHDPGAVSGDYRQGTASAVGRWYQGKGFQAHQPGVADQQQLGDLEAAVTDAQRAVLAARGGGAEAGSDGGGKGGSGASGPPVSGEASALELRAARQQLDRANAALSAFTATYGTKVPAGEVVFLPELPVRVDKVKVRLGGTPDGEVATVTSSDVVVRAVVPGADGSLLREGMAARVETADGTRVRGVVAQVGGTGPQADAGKDADGTGEEEKEEDEAGSEPDVGADPSAPVQLVISVPDPGTLKNQSGGTAKVTIEVGASKGAVLVVPVAAVHTSADGKARVQVQRDGQVVNVPVTVGLSAAGQVEVKADGGSLDEGDQVVVGR